MTDNPNPPDSPSDQADNDQTVNDQPVNSQEIEDFFRRLPANFRWPKPSAEAVAAAVEAIHRMTADPASAYEHPAGDFTPDPANACAGCGGSLPAGARFCIWCGLPKETAGASATSKHAGSSVQHHVHHHYHHVVPGQGTPYGAPAAEFEPSAPRGRAPASVSHSSVSPGSVSHSSVSPGSVKSGSVSSGSAGPAPVGRAEIAARQVVQDWAQACNTRHIDDLVELYAADATLIRSSIAPVRSLPAIREFLLAMLEAGLGDVEMESLRLEMMGEIAMDIGRCKMLVPVAMGKRREERGKYLVVLVRQPAGTWKILADCWSNDLPVNAPAPEAGVRKGSEPAAPVRKPR